MNPDITKLFKKIPHGNTKAVGELETRLHVVAGEIEQIEEKARVTYLEGSDADAAAIDRQIADKRRERDRIEGALVEARNRLKHNEKMEQDQATEAAWRKVEKMARHRGDLSVEIEVQVLKLVDSMKELYALNQEIYLTAPARLGKLHNSPLSVSNQEMALRLYMFKHGFNWAADYPWGRDDIPTFSSKIKQANAEILALRPKVEA
jgi:hypothetical protein